MIPVEEDESGPEEADPLTTCAAIRASTPPRRCGAPQRSAGLAGAGYQWQAFAAAAAVLGIDVALRPIGRSTDRAPLDEASEVETLYRFRATTRA